MATMIETAFLRSQTRSQEDGGCIYAYIEPNWINDSQGVVVTNGDYYNLSPFGPQQWNLNGENGAWLTSPPRGNFGVPGAWEVLANFPGVLSPVSVAVVDGGFPKIESKFMPYSAEYDTELLSNKIQPCTPTKKNLKDTECHHGLNVASVLGSPNSPDALIAGALGLGTPGLKARSDMKLSVQAVSHNSLTAMAAWAWVYAAGGVVGSESDGAALVVKNMNPAKIINYSAGSSHPCAEIEKDAVERLSELGAILVASAGNSRPTGVTYAEMSPASCDGVISVTGRDNTGTIDPRDFPGSAKSINAPGEGVIVLHSPKLDGKADLAKVSGTSIAAPHVSAVLAMMKAMNPNLTAQEGQDILSTTSTSTHDPVSSSNYSGPVEYYPIRTLNGTYALIETASRLGQNIPISIPSGVAVQ